MTNDELTNEFQILFEDLCTSGSKGLNNYEKSVCYTYAQEALIRQLSQQGNYQPFDQLVKTETVLSLTQSTVYKTGKAVAKTAVFFHEIAYYATDATKDIPGVTASQQQVNAMLTMPYQYPPKDLVYVVVGEDAYIVFLPLNFTAISFSTRYVEYPTPIILSELSGGDSINDETVETVPAVDEAFHRELVNAAVQYAIAVYVGQEEKEVKDGSSGN